MTVSPFDLMQRAVDIVGSSPHPANKIAATLAGRDAKNDEFSISQTNFWPEPVVKYIGLETRIGNSSGTLHAETACILRAPQTRNSSLFLTDPPCPNCVKNMAEAGVKALYIDHKGFDKDFAKRRGHHFDNMSMRICEKAGISVFRIFRKEQKLETILEIAADYVPAMEKPPHMEQAKENSAEDFSRWIKQEKLRYVDESYAVALADNGKSTMMISAAPHPVIGYTVDTMENPEGQYSFMLQPVNRVLMTAAFHGLKIRNGFLFSSIVPTSREFVNIIGAGLTKLAIGDRHAARDQYGPMALAQLEKAAILSIF